MVEVFFVKNQKVDVLYSFLVVLPVAMFLLFTLMFAPMLFLFLAESLLPFSLPDWLYYLTAFWAIGSLMYLRMFPTRGAFLFRLPRLNRPYRLQRVGSNLEIISTSKKPMLISNSEIERIYLTTMVSEITGSIKNGSFGVESSAFTGHAYVSAGKAKELQEMFADWSVFEFNAIETGYSQTKNSLSNKEIFIMILCMVLFVVVFTAIVLPFYIEMYP